MSADEWLGQFTAAHGRQPSPEEFVRARTAGFPAVGNAEPTMVLSTAESQPEVPAQSAEMSSRSHRRAWPIVAGVLVVALVAAGVLFGVPFTGFHGVLNSAGTGAEEGASGATRDASMPESVPSCPEGWTPVSWSSWNGGNLLVCTTTTGSNYHIAITSDGQNYSTDDGEATPTRGYYARFNDQNSAVIAFGGTLTQLSLSGSTTSHVTSQAWANGKSTGFTAMPASSLPSCPSGMYPFSMSVWGSQWLLTCGSDADSPKYFLYNDSASTRTGGTMVTSSDKFCAADSAGATICQNESLVTVALSGRTTTYPTQSSYLPESGITNSLAAGPTTTSNDARASLEAEITQDTPFAEAYLLGQWTPQLSAKWDGISVDGKTWTSQDISSEFEGYKQRYSTAMLLRSSNWSTLGLSDHDWLTMVAGISFSNAADANRWCYAQGFSPTNCYAVQLGHGAPVHTMQSWTPGAFGD